MKVEHLITHPVSGAEDDTFVGIKIIENDIHFYYPEAYHFDENDFQRDDVLNLLKTVSLAKSESQDESSAFVARENDSSEAALISYIWIIEDYLKNGVFTSLEKVYRTNQRGRVNWKRTMEQQPVISNGKVIYTNIVTEANNINNDLLSDIYKQAVKKSISLIGWLYGLAPNIIEVEDINDESKTMIVNTIRLALDSTYDDDRRTRLQHMENVVLGLDESRVGDELVYGVDSYHYIFERMIDSIFSTEKASDYYPSFKWKLRFSSSSSEQSGPTIRPDTIMSDENSIYVLDSKFYRYGLMNIAETKGLPEASSITKQILYGSYIDNQIGPDKQVFNAFILPYDSHGQNASLITDENKDLVYVGHVVSDWERKKSYSTIFTFLIDLRYVVERWNDINHSKIQKELATMIKAEYLALSTE